MVKNKLILYLSFILLFTSMVLNFQFPHKYPYGEAVFTILNIPIRFANGFHTVGITSLFLLILGIYLLMKSVNKHYGRVVFIAILVVIFTPIIIISAYQKTFASGIYAVSHLSEESTCTFEMTGKKTLYGECELSLINHSNDDVQFTVEFYEEYAFKNDFPMISLMNVNAPYAVILRGKEKKRITIKATIDVSDKEIHIDSGEAMGMEIIIKATGKSRSL